MLHIGRKIRRCRQADEHVGVGILDQVSLNACGHSTAPTHQTLAHAVILIAHQYLEGRIHRGLIGGKISAHLHAWIARQPGLRFAAKLGIVRQGGPDVFGFALAQFRLQRCAKMPISRQLCLHGFRVCGEQLKRGAGQIGVPGQVPAHVFLRILRQDLLCAGAQAFVSRQRAAHFRIILGEFQLNRLWQERRMAALRQPDSDLDIVVLRHGELDGFGQRFQVGKRFANLEIGVAAQQFLDVGMQCFVGGKIFANFRF
ncbi:hypothetical protein D9M72_234370 [compost metagenome]